MAQEICTRNKFGYCKHGDMCRYLHVNELCDNISCAIKSCNKRHPYICKFYRDHGRCKFLEYCKYKHEIFENIFENETKKEMEALNKKLDKVEKVLKQKEKDIENLHNLEMKLCEKMDESGKLCLQLRKLTVLEKKRKQI